MRPLLTSTTGTAESAHAAQRRVPSFRAHRQRAIVEALGDARSVVDLGCGEGRLVAHLSQLPQFERIVGVDPDPGELGEARQRLSSKNPRVELRRALAQNVPLGAGEIEAAVMQELIEHLDSAERSEIENEIFGTVRPQTVVVTTPNVEFNPRLGLKPGELRHPDHAFEWDRAAFAQWAHQTARCFGYTVQIVPVGPVVAGIGAPTQMAVFLRTAPGLADVPNDAAVASKWAPSRLPAQKQANVPCFDVLTLRRQYR